MKVKKTQIFWIGYYGVAIIGNVLAAALLRDKWMLSAYSFFPCLFIIGLIYLARCGTFRHNTMDDARFKPFIRKLWMLFAPLPLSFVLFFPDFAKCLSGLFILIGIIIIAVYQDFEIKKEADALRLQKQKERRAQEQLEESGKWK